MPFLLQDNLDLSGQQQQVIQAIDQDLAQLLRLPPQQFWQVVTSDDTLHTCLDSFLRFKRYVDSYATAHFSMPQDSA